MTSPRSTREPAATTRTRSGPARGCCWRGLAAGLLLLGACSGDPPAGGRPILVITLDTTRADLLGTYGGTLGVTPRLDALAATGVVFEDAYAPMPQTLPSHATLFTGLPPRLHGALENTYVLADECQTLAEAAARRGYATGAFVGSLAIEAATGMAQGFQVFDQPPGDWGEDRLGHPPQRRARQVTDSALAWADGLAPGRPFLLWAHYYDPHGDGPHGFSPPQRALEAVARGPVEALVASRSERFTAGTEVELLNTFWHGYAAELLATDEQVGRLLDGLADRGLLADTLIVVVADHGEGLWEHGVKAHGTHLWEEVMRVPFFVIDPRGGGGRRVSGRVTLQDIDPTLRHGAFGEPPRSTGGLLGRDLWPVVQGGSLAAPGPVFLERPHFGPDRLEHRGSGGLDHGFLTAVLLDEWKLVRQPDGAVTLYDLAADPAELVDLAAAQPALVERLGGVLRAWMDDHPTGPPGSAEYSEERAATLTALGYIGDEAEQVAAPDANEASEARDDG